MHSGISPLEHYNLHFCHFFLTSCYSKTTLLLVLCDISPLEHCNLHYCYIVFFYFDGVHFILVFCMALSNVFFPEQFTSLQIVNIFFMYKCQYMIGWKILVGKNMIIWSTWWPKKNLNALWLSKDCFFAWKSNPVLQGTLRWQKFWDSACGIAQEWTAQQPKITGESHKVSSHNNNFERVCRPEQARKWR